MDNLMTWAQHSSTRSVPYTLQQACFKRDQWTCQGCGYQGRQTKGDLHADHIHNRAEGGQNTLDNLTTLCRPCHEPKTARESVAGRNGWKRRPERHPSDLHS